MVSHTFYVMVSEVRGDCMVSKGELLGPFEKQTHIGRGTGCDVVLPDQTISRRHLRIERTRDDFLIHNLSRRGTTYVAMQPLAFEETKRVRAEQVWVQVGRVLLRVCEFMSTQPYETVLPTPSGASLLRLTWYGQHCEVRVREHLVSLFPSAVRALWLLAREPGHWVSHAALHAILSDEHSMGAAELAGTRLPQVITYIREMLFEALEADFVTREALSGALKDDEVASLNTRELLRRIVANRRAVGYCLQLPPHEVVVEGRPQVGSHKGQTAEGSSQGSRRV